MQLSEISEFNAVDEIDFSRLKEIHREPDFR